MVENKELAKDIGKIPEKLKIPEIPLMSLSLEIGFTIAIPIVALALLGRMADKYFDTTPLLLLAGILLSIFISIFLIYRKVRKYF